MVGGGGQAGLAAGYHLRRRGLDFIILDADPAPGGSWQHMWDSLHLFSPAEHSSLPGQFMPEVQRVEVGAVLARRSAVIEGLAGRPPNMAACQALANSAGADSGCGQRPMSASHWLVVRGVTPSSFWAEVSGAIERPGMALIAW